MADDEGAPTVPDDTAFLLVTSAVVRFMKELRDAVTDAGFEVTAEHNLDLNPSQAKAVLTAGATAATDAIRLAEEADAAAKKKKPKKKADEDEEPSYAETVHSSELEALVETRVAFLALHKGGGVEAVNELRALLGPSDPSEWASAPESLRARFQSGDEADGGGGGAAASAGAGEGDGDGVGPFNRLFGPHTPDHARAMVKKFAQFEMQAAAMNEKSGPSLRDLKKSDRVQLDQLLDFCFPPSAQHPRSTGRLLVFSLYGPFNAKGQLTSGIRGQHVVQDIELKAMVDEVEQEDILAVYVKDKGMSAHEKREVLVAADVAAKKLPNMRREQMEKLLGELKTDADGSASFHEVQKLVLGHRKRRLKEMKRMFPTVTSATGKDTGSAIRAPPPAYGRKLGRPKDGKGKVKGGTMLDPTKKISDTEGFKVVSRLLSSQVHGISNVEEANAPGLTANVRLLRALPKLEEGGWDDTCCIKGTNSRYTKRK